jgi:hypothetical protein
MSVNSTQRCSTSRTASKDSLNLVRSLASEPPSQVGQFLRESIEDAAVLVGPSQALLGCGADAEHALEDEARIGLRSPWTPGMP